MSQVEASNGSSHLQELLLLHYQVQTFSLLQIFLPIGHKTLSKQSINQIILHAFKVAGLLWPFLDHEDFLKMNNSVLRYSKIVKI